MSVIEAPAPVVPELEIPAEIELAVDKGWALLDEHLGVGWWKNIDCSALNLASSCDCVLGQLHSDYATGLWTHDITYQGREYGFTVSALWASVTYPKCPFVAWDVLTAAWKKRLNCEKEALA